MISVELVRLKTTKGIENLLHVDNGRFTSPRIKIFTPTGIKMVFIQTPNSIQPTAPIQNMFPYHCQMSLYKWSPTAGDPLTPQGHLAGSGDVFGCHSLGLGGCCWHPVERGQGCCPTSQKERTGESRNEEFQPHVRTLPQVRQPNLYEK